LPLRSAAAPSAVVLADALAADERVVRVAARLVVPGEPVDRLALAGAADVVVAGRRRAADLRRRDSREGERAERGEEDQQPV
jgi:hypothetical protein